MQRERKRLKPKEMTPKGALLVPIETVIPSEDFYRVLVVIERIERGARGETTSTLSDRVLTVGTSSIEQYDHFWNVGVQRKGKEEK